MGPSVFLLDEKALLQTQAPFATIKNKTIIRLKDRNKKTLIQV